MSSTSLRHLQLVLTTWFRFYEDVGVYFLRDSLCFLALVRSLKLWICAAFVPQSFSIRLHETIRIIPDNHWTVCVLLQSSMIGYEILWSHCITSYHIVCECGLSLTLTPVSDKWKITVGFSKCPPHDGVICSLFWWLGSDLIKARLNN